MAKKQYFMFIGYIWLHESNLSAISKNKADPVGKTGTPLYYLNADNTMHTDIRLSAFSSFLSLFTGTLKEQISLIYQCQYTTL